MRLLLDVNVLIALIDPLHGSHLTACEWFEREPIEWATCPITENAVLRIVGSSRYANSPGSPAAAAAALGDLVAAPGHAFWPDDVSLLDAALVDVSRLLTPAQTTDSYLLALAVKRGGRLATFDRRLVTDAVRGGREALVLL
ncbi:PIN domain-containing protein [Chelatococcus sambhunathii]|uniref:Ribonuclease VapC n=1 Tax=Chelatococcus sambhunathii TaxID=363953 RepID=A0ABU1DCZ4_9HYPH|nr:TA system VapC family ribonuclease toxin [Chelatococcus sambhunathii]MDR4305978.1 PIN domain-containing protein [Chelatococcus sambhunathii]